MHPQLNDMMERCMKVVEEHLREIIFTHQRDWAREYLSSFWPLEDQPTSMGESYICSVTCCWGSF
jgi:energy-coupling factor transporter ATP-binding protein EcfA2